MVVGSFIGENSITYGKPEGGINLDLKVRLEGVLDAGFNGVGNVKGEGFKVPNSILSKGGKLQRRARLRDRT